MFDLPPRTVHAVTSRLMGEELLPGAHDGPTGTIVIHHAEPSRLQVGREAGWVLLVGCSSPRGCEASADPITFSSGLAMVGAVVSNWC